MISEKRKDIDVRLKFTQEALREKVVARYEPTEKMPANVLTKPLCRELHKRHLYNLGVGPCNSGSLYLGVKSLFFICILNVCDYAIFMWVFALLLQKTKGGVFEYE